MIGPINTIQPVAPTIAANTPVNNSWFSGTQDFLKFGLDSWMQFEQVQKVKDSGSIGREEVLTTVQSPTKNTTTNVDENGNAQTGYDQAKLTELMTKGGLVLGGTVAAIAVLYFLTNKR
ncbi:hypothetical protein FLM48_11060 [Shewanella sp. Scap07]|uniref:hypothetical protein n=1 Tax=Shewanella sp. Scap07 TaxID=2589987 RepID=UPI0015B8A993|nr:hypothetical protein [Shewanella sp. Scap07]QLE85569.1 hypothetical protein FLM48_11060 [Shewanella sp. Scap07]